MSPEATDFDQSLSIPAREAEGLLRLLEAAPGVRRRYQFFVWMQTQVHVLMPHSVAVCGAWRRQIKELAWEVFHGVVLDDELLGRLTATGSAPLRQVMRLWLDHGGLAMTVPLHVLLADASDADARDVWQALIEVGLGHVLVHGVSRPGRASELESVFVFAAPGGEPAASRTYFLELLLPHLHAVYLRVQTTERELGALPPRARLPAQIEAELRWHLTDRERQILFWVREGKSNQQIGEQLEISPLTVKNHIQKILRKMGAANRAQAVSLAIGANQLKDPRRDEIG